jgi:DNA-binding CsgD family transcriptional regulator
LRWATPLENQDDKDAHGTAFPTAKLTVAQVAEILSLKGAATQKQIAARFNVSQPTVSAIHRGARWVRALAKAK